MSGDFWCAKFRDSKGVGDFINRRLTNAQLSRRVWPRHTLLPAPSPDFKELYWEKKKLTCPSVKQTADDG